MGKQGKKKRNIEKRKRRKKAASSSKPFPLDLTSDILLRLPAKSVARFRCVSKLWSSIITEQYFINSFGARFSPEPNLLLFFKIYGKMFVFSIPEHSSNSNSTPFYSYVMTEPKGCSFSPTESVHGLICFRQKSTPVIWNPATRRLITLCEPEKSWNSSIKVFLGYDPIEGKHKVLCIPSNKTCDECRVLTLGSAQESWRSIKHNQKHRPLTSHRLPHLESCGRCINGVLYYKAIRYGSNVSVLMSFDVRSEKFDMIELPPDNSWSRLIPYQGRLGCLLCKTDTLFVLEDANIWSCKDYHDHSRTTFRLHGISHSGEFIYVSYSLGKSFYFSYFDPERNTFTKVPDDQYFRLKNGLRGIDLLAPYYFHDHIENPLSL